MTRSGQPPVEPRRVPFKPERAAGLGGIDVPQDEQVAILERLGKPRSLIRFVKDRPGHDWRYAIDPTKIERELGWQPRETWRSGLDKTIRWYEENSDWAERARDLTVAA